MMKPILEKQNYYNLILMRDDAGVRTWRLKRATLKFLIWFLVSIFVLAVLGVTGTIFIGKRYLELSEKHNSQQALLVETKLQLERFSSFETLLQVSENGNGGTKIRNDEVGLLASADDAAHSVEGKTVNDEDQNSLSDGADAVTPELASDAPASSVDDNPIPLISSEASPIKVEGLNIREQGSGRFRVRYELHSKNQPQQVVGSVEHVFIVDNGSRITPRITSADTRFSIQYMKAIENTLRLPDEVDPKSVKSLLLIVSVGQNKYQEIFDISAN